MISPLHEILEKDLSLKKLIANAQYRISADSSLLHIYDRSKEISFLKKSKVSLQYDSYNAEQLLLSFEKDQYCIAYTRCLM